MVEPCRRVLGDRYELDELIASGGMGQVWRARDTLLGRPVAIKVLRSEYTGDPSFLARFRAEATHAAALSHPNIAAVYDYGEVDGDCDGEHLAYLVMELVDGEPLSTRLRDEGPLTPEDTLSVLRQTAVALAEAHHAGLVHRDVKPGNILLSPDAQVKITDFGIAWSAGSVPLTQAGQVLGTPQYLPPELAVGGSPSPASDVYSLGLVGYECLTGEPAFAGDNPVTIALKQVNEAPDPLPADLPPGIRELVDGAVAKDPGERIPDGDAFVAAIDRVRAGRPLDDGPATTRAVPLVPAPAAPRGPARGAHPPVPADRRSRLRTLLPAVLALLIGAGLVVALAGTRGGGGSPVAETPQQAPAIVLDDARYVGRPVDEVALELTGLGLTVERQRQLTDGVAPGDVTQLDPAGRRLHPGDAVTVFFAAPPGSGQSTSAEQGGAVPVADVGGGSGSVAGSAAARGLGAGSRAASSTDPAGATPVDPTGSAAGGPGMPGTATGSQPAATTTTAAPTTGPTTGPTSTSAGRTTGTTASGTAGSSTAPSSRTHTKPSPTSPSSAGRSTPAGSSASSSPAAGTSTATG